MVGFLDDKNKAHTVDLHVCAPVSGGYRADCGQAETVTIVQDQGVYCGTGYAVVGVVRDGDLYKTMKCCKVVAV